MTTFFAFFLSPQSRHERCSIETATEATILISLEGFQMEPQPSMAGLPSHCGFARAFASSLEVPEIIR